MFPEKDLQPPPQEADEQEEEEANCIHQDSEEAPTSSPQVTSNNVQPTDHTTESIHTTKPTQKGLFKARRTPQEGAALLDSLFSSAMRTLHPSSPGTQPATVRSEVSQSGEDVDWNQLSSEDDNNQEIVKSNSNYRGFYQCRQFLCVVIGIAARLSLLTTLGEQYVQVGQTFLKLI